MNCSTATDWLVGYLKNELGPHEKEQLEEHLAQCVTCREELEKARRILKWVDAASSDVAIRRVNEVVARALASRASDIHFEPNAEGGLRVRYRIDGALFDCEPIQPLERDGMISRLKMLGDMSVSSSAHSQQGRWRTEIDGKSYDFRMTVMPYVLGEGICIRILDCSNVVFGLDRLSMDEKDIETVMRWIKNPNGIVIVGGPTGSGKTTVIYSMLSTLDSDKTRIVSIEDPVEYLLNGVSQAQVNRKEGFTFCEGIRALLRSDPDVLYIGDISDLETARAVCEAALTGHLCMTNIHGDNAFAIIDQLLRLGLDAHILAQTLNGVSCQRLVRKLCPKCATRPTIPPEEMEKQIAGQFLGITADEILNSNLMVSVGCDECRQTGFRGRAAIYEMLTMSYDLAQVLVKEKSGEALREHAIKEGFRSMADEGKQKVLAGVTSAEEVFRVLASSF